MPLLELIKLLKSKLFTRKKVMILIIFHAVMFYGMHLFFSPYDIEEVIPVSKNKVLVLSEKARGDKTILEKIDLEKGREWKLEIPGFTYRYNSLKTFGNDLDIYYDIKGDILVYNYQRLNSAPREYQCHQFAVNVKDGKLLWQNSSLYAEGDEPFYGITCFGDSKGVYTLVEILKKNAEFSILRVKAQDRATGAKLWETDFAEGSGRSASVPLLTKDYIIFEKNDHRNSRIIILNKKNGNYIELANSRAGYVSGNKYYYFVKTRGGDTIYSIDLNSQKKQAHYKSNSFFFQAPDSGAALYKGDVLVYDSVQYDSKGYLRGNQNHRTLRAIDLQTGKKLWDLKWQDAYEMNSGFLSGVIWRKPEYSPFYSLKERYVPLILEKDTINKKDEEYKKLVVVDGESGSLVKAGKPVLLGNTDFLPNDLFYKDGYFYINIPYAGGGALLVFDPVKGKFLAAVQVNGPNLLFPEKFDFIMKVKNKQIYLVHENELTVVDILAGKVIYGDENLEVKNVLPGVLKEYGLE
ncbi:MAG: hypothetical protein GY754_35705 [bacterium]|nr:hypothetical protein [bacterium]